MASDEMEATPLTMSVQRSRTSGLEESEIFHILGNDRRRSIITFLAERQETLEVSDVATWIAEQESESNAVPNNLYKSVYVSLQQTHLPQLEEDDVVEYDADAKTIRAGEQFPRVLEYVDSPTGPTDRVLHLHLGLCIVGLASIVAAGVGVPVVATAGPVLWSVVVLVVIAISSLYCLIG